MIERISGAAIPCAMELLVVINEFAVLGFMANTMKIYKQILTDIVFLVKKDDRKLNRKSRMIGSIVSCLASPIYSWIMDVERSRENTSGMLGTAALFGGEKKIDQNLKRFEISRETKVKVNFLIFFE